MSHLQPALTFDGIDDYIEVPYSDKHNSKVFTMSCWAKPTKKGGMHGLTSTRYWSSSENIEGCELSIYFTDARANGWFYGIYSGITGYGNCGYSPFEPALNIWTHVALTFDDSRKVTFYINGQVIQQNILPSYEVNTHSSLCIGAVYHPNEKKGINLFEGQIAEVCIWNKARTQQELQSDMSKRLTGKEAGLVGYWPLNEGCGNTAIDKTSNGKNGIIKGATWNQEEIPLKPIESTSGEL